MKNTYIILVFASLFYLFACNRTSKEITQQQKTTEPITAPKKEPANNTFTAEKFDPFYQKFHKDSLFQVSRIKFPIRGYFIDSMGVHAEWTKDNWLMHKSIVNKIDTSKFKVDKKLTATSYEEKIYIEGGGFSAERIFKMLEGKWYLVLYIDEDL